MLGFICLFVVIFLYYKLAEDYNKKTGKYILIGIVFYCISLILSGILLLIIGMLFFYGKKEPDYIGFIIPSLGLLMTLGLYFYMKKRLKINKNN